MADDFNQTPYGKTPDWATQQAEAQRVLAEQQEEIAQAKQAEDERKQAAAAAAEEAQTPEEADRQRGRDFGRVIAMERARAAQQGQPAGRAGKTGTDTSALDKEISRLQKRASNDWQFPYFSLLFWAVVVDLLQLLTDLTWILGVVASVIGVIFSAARYIIINYECKRLEDDEYRKQAVSRTLISGAISMIPWVDLLPEQTMGMVYEYGKRRLMASQAEDQLKKKRQEREQLVAASRAAQAAEERAEMEEAEALAA